MSQIIKAFTGVFFILLMMCLSVGIVSMFLQTVQAQNLHAAMLNELENSNFAKAVIEECFLVSEELGYDLDMTLYDRAKGVVVCEDFLFVPEDCSDISMVELELNYRLKMDLFGIDVEQKLFGYGR